MIAAYCSSEAQLSEAIASARDQTCTSLEIIVSDDSPSAKLQSVAHASGDSRIRYFHHSPGLGAARNHWWCLAQARGEFVAILNHDDRLEPQFVETLLPPLLNDDAVGLSFCDHWVIDAEGHRLQAESDVVSASWGRSTLREGVHRPFLQLLADQSIPMAMGTIFRKSLLPECLPCQAGPAYDLWLTYLIARTGKAAHYFPRRLSSWRTHAGNLTSQAGTDWLRGATDCWISVSADLSCLEIRPIARRKAARGLAGLAVRAVADGERTDATCLALRSMSTAFTSKAGAAWLLSHLPASIARQLVAAARAR